VIAEVGSYTGILLKHLQNVKGVKKIYLCDNSEDALYKDAAEDIKYKVQPKRIVTNDEQFPMEPGSLDLVISNLWLHWINDLPNYLIQIRKSLKNDGLFLASMLGGDTLKELRDSFALAEMERSNGLSPHISPFAGLSDIGSVLNWAGFNLLTIDTELIRMNYADPLVLMHELQCMGEGNAVIKRRRMSKDLLLATISIYKSLYSNADGSVPATFQVIYIIGWNPDFKQPIPKPRGSAQYSLKDLSKMSDRPLGLIEEDEEEDKEKKNNLSNIK